MLAILLALAAPITFPAISLWVPVLMFGVD